MSMVFQELAGYTGGDASFLKEDFEIQMNRRLFWDSVRFEVRHKYLWVVSSTGCNLIIEQILQWKFYLIYVLFWDSFIYN